MLVVDYRNKAVDVVVQSLLQIVISIRGYLKDDYDHDNFVLGTIVMMIPCEGSYR